MRTKNSHPAELLDDGLSNPVIRAYFELCQLKQLYRQGWLRRGVPPERCESVAEHSFGVAVLALWLAQAYFPQLDALRTVRMALLHDFGEVYAGDIIPSDPLSDAEKQQRERQSVQEVFGKLPGGEAWIALWEEFEAGQTPEARLIRQLDRLEMGLQAGVYQRQGQTEMDTFHLSARKALTDPELVAILEELWRSV